MSAEPPERAKAEAPIWPLALLLIAAVGLGGGGVAYGLFNLVVIFAALVALGLSRQAFLTFWRDAPLALCILSAATLALPLLQIVPLPEGLWQALPGRELAQEARAAAGSTGWAPLSLDAGRTLVALTGLIAPLAVLCLAWTMRWERVERLAILIAALGLANLAIGTVQVTSAGTAGLLYPENPMPGVLFGTFANRNSAGLFLVASFAIAALYPLRNPGFALNMGRVIACALLLLAVLLTQSRTAIAIALVPLVVLGLKLLADRYRQDSKQPTGKSMMVLAGGLLAVIAIAAMAIASAGSGSRLDDVAERFQSFDDDRALIWQDAAFSGQRFMPLGAGMGTFDEVFQTDESLENFTPRRAGRAHNDYLELVIEAGLPGIALLIGWAAFLAWATCAARMSRMRWAGWSGSVIIAAIALQSLLDYPLRNQAMLCLAAFAIALVTRAAFERGDQP